VYPRIRRGRNFADTGRVLTGCTGFGRMLTGCAGLGRVLTGCAGLGRMLTGCAGLVRMLTACADVGRMLTGCAAVRRLLTGCAGLGRMLTGSAGVERMLTGCADIGRMLTGCADVERMLTGCAGVGVLTGCADVGKTLSEMMVCMRNYVSQTSHDLSSRPGGQVGQFAPGRSHFYTQYLLSFSRLVQLFCNRGPRNSIAPNAPNPMGALLIFGFATGVQYKPPLSPRGWHFQCLPKCWAAPNIRRRS
jgi:hypothetical protein